MENAVLDTLFLDRDGVINKKITGRYVCNWDEFDFMPDAEKAIGVLSQLFKRVLVVTNQQGIAKGIMTEEDLHQLHNQMISQIESVSGKIVKIYYCPHLASEHCTCRKPKTGMIQQAMQDFDIRLSSSYLVGDSDTDIQAGDAMGLHTVKVDNEFTLHQWTEELLDIINYD